MKKTRKAIGTLVLVFIAQFLWCKFIFWFLFLSIGTEEMSLHFSSFIEGFLISVVLAPLTEEFLFRKLPLSITKSYLPKYVLTVSIASSIIFGLIHGSSINVLIQGMFGLIWCRIYLKHGFWLCVLSHALWNFFCLLT